ncbi:MAG: adenylate/guanylate cyclase domain-containing protein, partial [Leptospiraceae bacterium]|nr:adenylate/guanylate cyclase domain-containing protein [Leptospiraceae bacterium]
MQNNQLNYFITIFIVVGVFAYISLFGAFSKPVSLKASQGKLDLSGIDLSKTSPIRLDGEWEFYPMKLYSSSDFKNNAIQGTFIQVPKAWNYSDEWKHVIPTRSYATYRLVIKLENTNQIYSIKIPGIQTAYTLYANGKVLTRVGKVATNPKEAQPSSKNMLINFITDQKELELIFHVSNYHFSSAGIWTSLFLSTDQNLISLQNQNSYFELFLFGSLIIMGGYHLFLYLMRSKNKAAIYFAFLCIFIATRVLLAGETIIFSLLPFLTWFAAIKLLFFLFPVSLVLFAFFNRELFPDEFNNKLFYFNVFSALPYLVVVLAFDSYTISKSFIYLVIVILLQMLIYLYVIVKASFLKREGASVFLIGYIAILTSIINDILHDNGVIHTQYLVPFGFFTLIFCQAIMLAFKFTLAFFQVENLSDRLLKTNAAYRRFVPEEFLKFLNHKEITSVKLGDQVRKEMSIFFSDIRSFTALSEAMSPEENFKFLNSYLKRAGKPIQKFNGFIDKFIGDAIMALFPEKPEDAIKAAIETIRMLHSYNAHRIKFNYSPIKVGIGIHTGDIMLGTIGYQERMESTVISDAVNLASRMEGLTKYYGANILISEDVLKGLEDESKFNFRVLDWVQVKGKNKKVTVIEILDGIDEVNLKRYLETKPLFEMAVNSYILKDIEAALNIFKEVISKNPSDKASELYIKRCEYFIKNGIP